MIAIYNLSKFFFLLITAGSFALANANDINSYCFEESVRLRDVHQSLKILLLPKDIVDFRDDENCLDIITSVDRGNLFSKFLEKRYALKRETRIENPDCRLDLRTTKKRKIEGRNLKIGEKNTVSKTEGTSSDVSTMELLLGEGKSGEISLGETALKITCQLIGGDSANLIFSFVEKDKVNLNSQVTIKKNEWLNVASILKDLNDKRNTVGIPQTEAGKTEEKIETVYELQFK